MYDLIGDIHGHAPALVSLLAHLGYRESRGVYRHSTRKVIFLGDFIDRGPEILRTLTIVRAMVDAGEAQAVMGNHEWNALCYHTPDPKRPGQFLRKHTEKNEAQHRETLKQLAPATVMDDALTWFAALPMWLDLPGLRVVHACWDEVAIRVISSALERNGVSTDFLADASRKDAPLYEAVEIVLKGKEIALPLDVSFFDKEENMRRRARIRWYLPAAGKTFGEYCMGKIPCNPPLPASAVGANPGYPPGDRPVFIGHYWLNTPLPALLAPNVACVDYSVAKAGYLCAYRWSGEQTLTPDHFAYVRKSP